MSKESFKFKTKDNIVYFNFYEKKKSNNPTEIKFYDKTYHHFEKILRADDSTKEISPLSRTLCTRLIYALGKNNNRSIFKSNEWFKDITKKCTKQTSRIRNQLNNIFNFKFYQKVTANNETLFNVFEVSFTSNAFEILDLEDLKKCPDPKTENVQTYRQKCPEIKTKMSSPYNIDKEKEEESLRDYSSSFSDNDIRKDVEVSSCANGFLNKPAQDENKKVHPIGFERKDREDNIDSTLDFKPNQNIFVKFKKNIDDPDIVKDFETFASLYDVTESNNGLIILECTNYFADRITQCNRLERLQEVINKIGISLKIKHKGPYREDIELEFNKKTLKFV